MEVIETGFEGLYEIKPRVFGDQRGYFFESYRESVLKDLGLEVNFVQDNQSFSVKGTLRGLHFQRPPFAQAKLVRVVAGKVLDVVLDIRPDSPTYGKHYSLVLDAEVNNMLYVPEGFAHGFAALEDSIFFYKCTQYYDKPSEGGILWNDPALAIDWQITDPIVSEKDQGLPVFDVFKEHLAF